MAKLTMKCVKEENFLEIMEVVCNNLSEISTESRSFFVGDNVQFSAYKNPKGELFVRGAS